MNKEKIFKYVNRSLVVFLVFYSLFTTFLVYGWVSVDTVEMRNLIARADELTIKHNECLAINETFVKNEETYMKNEATYKALEKKMLADINELKARLKVE